MEKMRCQKSAHDEDVDVDRYFLPGGILDTPSQREEDMIGGSLLDEIGGVGNVTLLPTTQIKVSRIVGSADPQSTSELRQQGPQELGSRSHQQARPVGEGRPIRLSVEGTNPMAKEFTPAACPITPEVTECTTAHGASFSRSQHLVPDAPRTSRIFPAAVGSEVNSAAMETPGHGVVGSRRHNPQQQPGWSPRTTGGSSHARFSASIRPPLSILAKHGPVAHHGRRVDSGLSARGELPQRIDRSLTQGHAPVPGPSNRRERVAPGKYYGGRPGQNYDAIRESNSRAPSQRGSRQMGQPQRKPRPQGSPSQLPMHCDNSSHMTCRDKSGRLSSTSATRALKHPDIASCAISVDQGPLASKALIYDKQSDGEVATRTPGRQARLDEHYSSTKDHGGVEDGPAVVVTASLTSSEDDDTRALASHHFPASAVGQASKLQQASRRAAVSTSQLLQRGQEVPPADESDVLFSTMAHVNRTPVRWSSTSLGRGAHQAKPEEDSLGLSQPHAQRDKDKARSKKKEEKIYRASTRQLMGSVKETSRTRAGGRPSVFHRCGGLRSSIRVMGRAMLSVALKSIVGFLSRLGLFRRLLALLSFATSSGMSILSVAITATSWLLLVSLRVHSVALKEATGSVHVAVCFLFPYFFRYLVSIVDEWAPHWLPACLWYSFLMQMFCTSSHLCQHSMSSHLVPALRALLPVAFLCEVPSGRSYLLALGGSELLLLSFALAAVRLRCLFSPVFLLSWSSQVFAIATFGSTSGLQYCQLLISLASLHAISMVDVMLNSRLYHARYRAGMSLTTGFRVISLRPPKLT